MQEAVMKHIEQFKHTQKKVEEEFSNIRWGYHNDTERLSPDEVMRYIEKKKYMDIYAVVITDLYESDSYHRIYSELHKYKKATGLDKIDPNDADNFIESFLSKLLMEMVDEFIEREKSRVAALQKSTRILEKIITEENNG